jgi:hypothetical protein
VRGEKTAELIYIQPIEKKGQGPRPKAQGAMDGMFSGRLVGELVDQMKSV